MIALVGQSTRDVIVTPDGRRHDRLGGAPRFAAEALAAAGRAIRVITRGADDEIDRLRGPGIEVVHDAGRATTTMELRLQADGEREQSIVALGDPFTSADVRGWLGAALDGIDIVVLGGQTAGDFPPGMIAAIAHGRTVLLDGQGPARTPIVGPLRLARPPDLDRLLERIALLKVSEDEAAALFGAGSPDARCPVVVTRGPRPATLWDAGLRIDLLPVAVPGLTDAIGAGDAFLAFCAAGVEDGLRLADAAAAAMAATAAFLTRRVRTG